MMSHFQHGKLGQILLLKTIFKNNNNDECIQLLQDDRLSILNQHFPPLGINSSPPLIHQNSPLLAPHQISSPS
ncbi:hypothetical protein LguiA_002638 [Lonicera macranthoides]